MNHILLLGAGFSRNWGGWVATEVFEYLLGCAGLGESAKSLLWDYKEKGGFEAALGRLQQDIRKTSAKDPRLEQLTKCVIEMFEDMNSGFPKSFEFSNMSSQSVGEFLARFDAIFTLNQDLLLETHYLSFDLSLRNSRRWDGAALPGLKPEDRSEPNLYQGILNPCSELFKIQPRTQPIIKLHGSTNWRDPDRDNLMVIGGQKKEFIKQNAVLNWYAEEFISYLSMPDTRLMIIGYGFGDDHINDAIRTAARNGGLSLFIVDPSGVDILDRNRKASIPQPCGQAQELWPLVIGASRRGLRETFGTGGPEHNKIMRFFD